MYVVKVTWTKEEAGTDGEIQLASSERVYLDFAEAGAVTQACMKALLEGAQRETPDIGFTGLSVARR